MGRPIGNRIRQACATLERLGPSHLAVIASDMQTSPGYAHKYLLRAQKHKLVTADRRGTLMVYTVKRCWQDIIEDAQRQKTPGATLAETLTDLIDENGPMSVDEMAKVTGQELKHMGNIVSNLVRVGQMHICGDAPRKATRGCTPKLYTLGPGPGWLPHPMPVNSVFQLGGRA